MVRVPLIKARPYYRYIYPILPIFRCVAVGVVGLGVTWLLVSIDGMPLFPILLVGVLIVAGLVVTGYQTLFVPPPPPVFCPQCDRHIPTDVPWRCGRCEAENLDVRHFPFIHQCKRCKHPADAVVCPRCNTIALLEKVLKPRHCAEIVIRDVVTARSGEDIAREKAITHQETKLQWERQIELLQLEAKFKKLKESVEYKEKVSTEQRIRSKFTEFQAEVLGFKMLERNERRRINEEFANDPDRREMEHLAVDEFMRNEGLEPTREHETNKGTV